MTKNVKLSTITAIALLSIIGCGGGGGSTSSGSTATSTTSSGRASDGYISGATVCLDMNINNACDNGEPSTTTQGDGSYSLVVSAAQKANAKENAPLLLVGGVDIDTKTNLTGTFKAPFDKTATTTTTQITPLTTLVSAMVDKNVSVVKAYEQVAKSLGLTEEEVKSDPVKLAKDNNNTKVIQAAMTIHRVVTTMAQSASVENSKIYSDLVTAINTVADDNALSEKSIATIVTTAATETNSTLPPKAIQVAVVAPSIETTISNAIHAHPGSIRDAALASSEVVNIIQETVNNAIENNITINVGDIDNNASTALTNASANLVKIAVKNLLTSYLGDSITISESNLTAIASNFTSSSDVSIEEMIKLNDDSYSSIIANLQVAYKKEQIKSYVLNLGYQISDSQIALLNLSDFSPTMTKEAFATMIYNIGNAELMRLALEINPPENIASLSDIQKAKNLFTSVRTQVNEAGTFTQEESTKITRTLNGVSDSVTFTAIAFNTISDMISQAIDTNQTSVSRLVGANDGRNITITKLENAHWTYTIKDTNVETPWNGSLIYTDVDPDNFNPSSFTPLSAKLTGTMPIDFYNTTIATGKTNSQSVDATIKITKIANGATLHLDAKIDNNGDSVSIKDANLKVAYSIDSATQEPLPQYVELQNLYVNGTVGSYTLDGKLDLLYAINKIGTSKGFNSETTYSSIGGEISCDGNSITNLDNVTFTYNGQTYPINHYYYNGFYNNQTHFWMNFDNIKGAISYANGTNPSNYQGLEQCVNPQFNNVYAHSWTENDFQNSGHYPSKITFGGKLTNDVTSAYLNANIDAKWTDIVDANLSDSSYEPKLDVTVDGILSMPESPEMKVGLNFVNSVTDKKVKVTYVNGDTAITADSIIPNSDNSNTTVNLSSSAGIKAKIVTDSNGNVDYTASKLTNTGGDTVGIFVDRAGAPAVKYADGTFETLF